MTRKLKRRLRRIIIALVLFLVILITDKVTPLIWPDAMPYGLASAWQESGFGWILLFGLYFAVYIYIGYDVLKKAFLNLIHGRMLDENFLMTVATIGAFGLGIYTSVSTHGEQIEGFDEACAVLLFYQIGEWFQTYAVGKSRASVSSLMEIRPDYANRLLPDETIEQVSPETVEIGEVIRILPGERVPIDGTVVQGATALDLRALTGESVPKDVQTGEKVLSGSVNLQGTIDVRTEKLFADSTVTRILNLVENASDLKSRSETIISRFAKYYTPIVVGLALLLAVVPTLIAGFEGNWAAGSVWTYRALSFLVVSCPCALVISVPLTFFAGIGGASKKGILIKGSSHLERLAHVSVAVFDKTGPLTKGTFCVTEVLPHDLRDEVLFYAAIAESQSVHPIAQSIQAAAGPVDASGYRLENVPGMGVKVSGERNILCGNRKLLESENVPCLFDETDQTAVYVAVDGVCMGKICVADQIKDGAKDALNELNGMNIRTVMLTGDAEEPAKEVAETLSLSEYHAGLLPEDKVSRVEELLKNKNEKDMLCFVGDGINDAPVLMRSDIGIAMGGIGSDAAIEASDVVLMHDDLKDLPLAMRIARKALRICYENIWFALLVKVAILILSALGLTNMLLAVFGDVGVAVIAILNAMRTERIH